VPRLVSSDPDRIPADRACGRAPDWLRKGMGMVMYSSDLGFLLGDPRKGGLERLRAGG
jgi:hypothetical protein